MGAAQIQLKKNNALDPESRNEMIKEYLPYVKRIVHRIAVHLPPGIEIDDLIHVGVIGLIQAIDRYDPEMDNKFMTYAAFRIKGAVLSELRSRDYLSRSGRMKVRTMEDAHTHLERKLGREPEAHEIAKEMGVTLERYYETKRLSCLSFISLDEIGVSLKKEKKNIKDSFFQDDETDTLGLIGMKELETAVAGGIEALPEKERLVISMYYHDELTMKEIGRVLNLTESRVSQIHSQAIIHIRGRLKKADVI
jgi:RNA polymerase sigma factor for flagellar operon FliA